MSVSAQIIYREKFEREIGVHWFDSILIPLSGEFEYTVNNTKKRIIPYMPVLFKTVEKFNKKIIKPTICIRIISKSLPFFPKSDCLPIDNFRLYQTIAHLERAIKNNVSESVIEHLVNDILLFGIERENEFPEKEKYASYIKEHFNENITLSCLTKEFGYSKQTIIMKFKKYFNKTPVAYITDMRINSAKNLLQNTNKTIGEIAMLCGYENTYYFSNTFKKHTGLSPEKFKNQSIL